ncbi:hypothetical protein [Mannheimia massilioguelmaensis]|uniref:hypothetical protein n=1 Tax=Mannheimia massilioguelmaensis TaxID=1604354 RepID=UPI000A8DE2D9|nr:hypothetical protein [Mannheimia massilioguelmaensis]
MSLDHVAHSLGAASTKNAMNWAGYKEIDLNDTTLKGYVAGTSYPITNSTIGGRLSLGLYDQGYTEKAAGLFKDGQVDYTIASGDIVGTGINLLPWIPGRFNFGIGNTDTTGENFPRIPGRILTGDHTDAYYRDFSVINFLNNKAVADSIINYQDKIWGGDGIKIRSNRFNQGMINNEGDG